MSITPELRHNLENGFYFGCAFVAFWHVAASVVWLKKQPDITKADAQKFRSRLGGRILFIVVCQFVGIQAVEQLSTRAVPPAALPQGSSPASRASGESGGMREGDLVRIFCNSASPCVAAASEQDEQDITRAGHDVAGKEALARAYKIKSGTQAMFIKLGGGASGADAQVYFATGPDSVAKGWIPCKWLKKK